MQENPKAQAEGLCRFTYIGATGIEWICVKPKHDDGDHRTDEADRHLFVNRWPKKERALDDH